MISHLIVGRGSNTAGLCYRTRLVTWRLDVIALLAIILAALPYYQCYKVLARSREFATTLCCACALMIQDEMQGALSIAIALRHNSFSPSHSKSYHMSVCLYACTHLYHLPAKPS